ncbi:MAG: proline--tRNA ligase, partial [Elusimicrobia bacterium]|nr:proline--tRNA ligase [Elusimicrobiota bacterium]
MIRFSQAFIPTLREVPSEAECLSHQLMLRAGLIRKVAAGIYDWLPFGFRVLSKIEAIIRREMNAIGGQEILLPTLHPRELWDETGRWAVYGKELMRLADRHDREFALGPTHEEVITELARRELRSYRQLPFMLYQFQTKFRDELRPRFGVLRAREFLMKDAYSFHATEADAQAFYQTVVQAYERIFSRSGLRMKSVLAESGAIGGSVSHEFMVDAQTGEDAIVTCPCGYAANAEVAKKTLNRKDPDGKADALANAPCPTCRKPLAVSRGIEVGHTFQLGMKYSSAMHATFLDDNHREQPVIMGCYGIGVSRVVAAAIEQSHDDQGIIWPPSLAPVQVAIVPINPTEARTREQSEQLARTLEEGEIEVLLDDRDERAGVKFHD